MIKTKEEAIKLEKIMANIIGKAIDDETIELGMSLTGRLQVRYIGFYGGTLAKTE
jgi:hypothetical protein